MHTVNNNTTLQQYRIVTTCNVTPAYDTDFYPEQILDVQGKALWDTGATISAISIQVAQYLKLKPLRKQVMNTANGYTTLDLYEVNIELDNGMQFNDLLVCAAQLGDVQVLIGMDVITQGDLAITNGNRKTTFSFQIPATRNIEFDKEQYTSIQDAVNDINQQWIQILQELGVNKNLITQATTKVTNQATFAQAEN
jgi:hypothetical protein